MQRGIFRGSYDDFFLSTVEAKHILHTPVAGSQLLAQLTVCAIEVQVVEAVALALVDKLAVVPRQEYDGVLGFYVFGMCLFKKSSYQFACFYAVLA